MHSLHAIISSIVLSIREISDISTDYKYHSHQVCTLHSFTLHPPPLFFWLDLIRLLVNFRADYFLLYGFIGLFHLFLTFFFLIKRNEFFYLIASLELFRGDFVLVGDMLGTVSFLRFEKSKFHLVYRNRILFNV